MIKSKKGKKGKMNYKKFYLFVNKKLPNLIMKKLGN